LKRTLASVKRFSMQVGHHASLFCTPLTISLAEYIGFRRQFVQRLEGPPPAFFLFDALTAAILSPDEEDMVIVEERDRLVLGMIGGASAVSVGGLCRNFTAAKLVEVVAFLSSMIEMTLSQRRMKPCGPKEELGFVP
jgi:hypothetical protein